VRPQGRDVCRHRVAKALELAAGAELRGDVDDAAIRRECQVEPVDAGFRVVRDRARAVVTVHGHELRVRGRSRREHDERCDEGSSRRSPVCLHVRSPPFRRSASGVLLFFAAGTPIQGVPHRAPWQTSMDREPHAYVTMRSSCTAANARL
jgi:hypothetical protein